MDEEVENFLMHFGVKGMRWGVVNEDSTSGSSSKASNKSSSTSGGSVGDVAKSGINKKKLAIILGSAVGVAAIAGGAYYLHQKYKIPLPNSDTVKKVLKEPESIIHASRGKTHGFTFLKNGGLKDALHEYDRAGFNEGKVPQGDMRFYGDRMEKLAGNFKDPQGRKDFAGRPIYHEVILPATQAYKVKTFDEFQRFAWPQIKDDFDELYNRKKIL